MQVNETIEKTQRTCWDQSNKKLLAWISEFYFFFLLFLWMNAKYSEGENLFVSFRKMPSHI